MKALFPNLKPKGSSLPSHLTRQQTRELFPLRSIQINAKTYLLHGGNFRYSDLISLLFRFSVYQMPASQTVTLALGSVHRWKTFKLRSYHTKAG